MAERPAHPAAAVRYRPGGYDPQRANGPDTPVMDRDRLARVLDHASWRDPSVQWRHDTRIRTALAVLERTAACTDLAIERLEEAASAVEGGRVSASAVMRGLLATRADELLDSLPGIAALAGEHGVNLLDGGVQGLRVQLGPGALHYSLCPISLRRDHRGFHIPTCDSAFEDPEETAVVAAGIERARVRLARFADRLSQDAIALARLTGAWPDGPARSGAAPGPDAERST